MKKLAIITAVVLLLSISIAYATIIRPEIVPVDPLPGGMVSGKHLLKVDIVVPNNQTGDNIDVKQVMFRYIKSNCTSNCKVLIGNDLTEAFGWSVLWDTTVVPEGTYDLQIYAFAEGGTILLAQMILDDVVVDQSYVKPEEPKEVEEEPVAEPPKEIKEEAPKVAPKNVTTPPKAPEKKIGFWGSFFNWLKRLFGAI